MKTEGRERWDLLEYALAGGGKAGKNERWRKPSSRWIFGRITRGKTRARAPQLVCNFYGRRASREKIQRRQNASSAVWQVKHCCRRESRCYDGDTCEHRCRSNTIRTYHHQQHISHVPMFVSPWFLPNRGFFSFLFVLLSYLMR